jgi:hypothetical protein
MDWLNWWVVTLAIIIALYVAVRLVLLHYFPPDTPSRCDWGADQ